MNVLIYIVIVLSATMSGAITGLGGGVIIKPLFDLVGFHDASTIGFYSSVAVFTMCIVSIYKQVKNGFSFNIKVVILISMGSILGGLLGEKIFNLAISSLENNQVKAIQASLLGFTLILIIFYTLNKHRIKHYNIDNKVTIIIVGFLLGTISIFLGIGGGPLNVAVMMLLFLCNMKEAAVYSIATIFFSQVSKLATIIVSGKITEFELGFIPFICVASIIGGFIGTGINQRLNNKSIEKFYNLLMILLLFISIYNIAYNI